ncbi:hypothetical protein N7466_010994 [Penicillium verhagenii]|uniref:uncharacterized protein n=1 Tax=Penicillium verhagenii TaxID=1562060 RepID=UPI0025458067|nr:uncharacterized protein N7466_010994 [Penicillium verhagenii]KAJ5917440.1 hypothetical protein N7466_010994 [Penicillium verhagenii]
MAQLSQFYLLSLISMSCASSMISGFSINSLRGRREQFEAIPLNIAMLSAKEPYDNVHEHQIQSMYESYSILGIVCIH